MGAERIVRPDLRLELFDLNIALCKQGVGLGQEGT